MYRVVAILCAGCIDVHPFGDGGAPKGDAGSNDGAVPVLDATTVDAKPVDDGSVAILDGLPTSCPTPIAPFNPYDPVSFVSASAHGLEANRIKLRLDLSTSQPSDLLVGTTEVLENSAATCVEHTQMSSALIPGAGNHDSQVTGSFSGPVQGPGIAQLVTTWSRDYGCGSATVTTTWTAFPDDRLVRRDSITGFAKVAAQSCFCGGTSDAGQKLTAAALISKMRYDTVYDASGNELHGSLASNVALPICFTVKGAATSAADYDLVVLGQSSTDILDGGNFSVVSTLSTNAGLGAGGSLIYAVVPRGECAAAQTALGAYVGTFAVTINNTPYIAKLTDGIFDPPGMLATASGADAHVRLTQGVPPGFAVALRFSGDPHGFRVIRNGAELASDQAFVQPFGDHHVLWLRDPLGGVGTQACDDIVVRPQ